MSTVLQETDLDAPEPLKSALKQSAAGGEAPVHSEVVDETAARDKTATQEDEAKEHVASDEQ